MEKRLLGRTGLEVSKVGLGGHLFPVKAVDYYQGYYGRRLLESEAMEIRQQVMEAALTAGINLFAADFEYEIKALGQGLRHFSARDRVVVTAVVDCRFEPGQKVRWADLEGAVDHLLTLLGSDHLELPQIRVANWYAQCGLLEDLVGFCRDMALKGKILFPAFYSSDNDLEVLVHGLEKGWFQVVCRALGLLNPTAGRDLLPLVASAQAGFIGFIPFQKGWLFDCAQEAGLSAPDAAEAGLTWALQLPGVASLLCGASGPNEVLDNARAVSDSGQRPDWREVVNKLANTETYGRFFQEINQSAPQLAFDWRTAGEF